MIERIQELVKLQLEWSDEKVLKTLKALPVLPDEYVWSGNTYSKEWNTVWDTPETESQLIQFLALADTIADRKLREGVPLLLERASYGDMGETMRGLRHSLEAAFKPDWDALTDICIEAVQSTQRGCRLWAVRELGILRNTRAIPVLFEALRDSAILVQYEAILSLSMISDTNPETKQDVLDEFKLTLEELQNIQKALEKGIEGIQNK